MDALVTAGGSITPDDPLYAYGQDIPKSLLDVAGKPMVQWVLDALDQAGSVSRITVVGLSPDCGIHAAKLVDYVPDQGW